MRATPIGSNTYPILSVSGSKTGQGHSLLSSYQTKDLPRQWCNNMPRRDKAPETHGDIREKLGPLKQEGAHGWRILLDMPGLATRRFKVGEKTTKQALYICRNVQILYFSKDACMDVGILPPCFPKPMTSPPSLIDPIRCDAAHSKPRLSEVDLSEKQKTKTNSNYPRSPPF